MIRRPSVISAVLLAILEGVLTGAVATGDEPAGPRSRREEAASEEPDRKGQAYPDMLRVARHKGSFSAPRDLEAGEILRLRLTGLGENRRLRLHLCGPGCQTASTIGTWDASQLSLDGTVEITIGDPGRYYLWIEDFSDRSRPIGEMLRAESARWEEQTLVLDYGAGLEVYAEPVASGRAATASAASDSDVGGSVDAVAALCRQALLLERYGDATDAARRWIELAETPAESASAHRHLGRALVQHGMNELYPSRRAAPGSLPVSGDRILGTELLHQAAESFARATVETDGGGEVLGEASERVRHEEYAEALEVLGDYSPAGEEGLLAEELRCWAEEGLRKTAATPAGGPGDRVRAPVKLFAPAPEYTIEARKARIQGVVSLQLYIDEEGRVACARALTTLPGGLDAAAVAAAKKWRFEPATMGGEPVATYYTVTQNFMLR